MPEEPRPEASKGGEEQEKVTDLFEFVDELWTDPIGTCYRIVDSGERYLLTLLNHQNSNDRDFISSFQSGLEALAGIDNPAIAWIEDAGQLDDTRQWIRSPLREGFWLEDLILSRCLDAEAAVNIAIQLKEAAKSLSSNGLLLPPLSKRLLRVSRESELIIHGFERESLLPFFSDPQRLRYLVPCLEGSIEFTDLKNRSPESDVFQTAILIRDILLSNDKQNPWQSESFADTKYSPDLKSVITEATARRPENRPRTVDEFVSRIEELWERDKIYPNQKTSPGGLPTQTMLIPEMPAAEQDEAVHPALPTWKPPSADELAREITGFEVRKLAQTTAVSASYQASQTQLNRSVYLTILRSDFLTDPEIESGFLSHMGLALAFDFNHIARFFDYGISDGGYAYAIAEYPRGVNLADFQISHRHDPGALLTILDGITRALDNLHRTGETHGSLQLRDVWVDSDYKVKIFGLERSILKRMAANLVFEEGGGKGQLALAPEYAPIHEGSVTTRSDLFSLGFIAARLFQPGPLVNILTRNTLLIDPLERICSCAEFANLVNEAREALEAPAKKEAEQNLERHKLNVVAFVEKEAIVARRIEGTLFASLGLAMAAIFIIGFFTVLIRIPDPVPNPPQIIAKVLAETSTEVDNVILTKQTEKHGRALPFSETVSTSLSPVPGPRNDGLEKEDYLHFEMSENDAGFRYSMPGFTNGEAKELPEAMRYRRSIVSRMRRIREGGGEDRTELAVIRGLEFLAQQQDQETGAIGNKYKVGMTGLALLAFLGHGETPESPKFGDAVVKAALYLMEQARKNNGKMSSPVDTGHSANYEHAIATHALAEYFAITKKQGVVDLRLEKYVRSSASRIVNNQNPTGGWHYYFSNDPKKFETALSAWNLQALHSVKNSEIDIPGIDTTLNNSLDKFFPSIQDDEGSFKKRYDTDKGLSLSGSVLLALQTGDRQKSGVYMKGFSLLKLINSNPHPGRNYHQGYFDTQVFFNHGGKEWENYNSKFFPKLLDAQNNDGSWLKNMEIKVEEGRYSYIPGEDNNIYGTALAVLMLEVFYRYVPPGK